MEEKTQVQMFKLNIIGWSNNMSRMISENNLIQHELIGLKTTVIDTPCCSFKNISGQIVDETMNTFKIEYFTDDVKKIIIIPKHKTRFQFTLPAISKIVHPKTVEIDGSVLMKRPEDRIKKLAKLKKKLSK